MKIVIIGGGPGGYETAIRAAQLGAEVTLVEKDSLGGTCLNVGCIPTKALIHSADLFYEISKEAAKNGIVVEGVSVDFDAVQAKKAAVVKQLVNGVGSLMKAYGVTVLKGTASFKDASTLKVTGEDGEQEVAFDKAIIATGSVPSRVPIPGSDLPGVVDSTGALEFDHVPESLTIIGGGVIGIELSHVYQRLGTKVTIIEMLPDILGNMDESITAVMKRMLKRNKVKLHLESRVNEICAGDDGLIVKFTDAKGRDVENVSEKVLLCVGRRPYTDGLGLDEVGVATERGRVLVDGDFKTNVDSIYAIGDVIGGIMLAHVASAEGLACVEKIMGEQPHTDFSIVPGCVYTSPEIGCVGMTEKETVDAGIETEIGMFQMMGNGKALIKGETSGLVKIIARKDNGKVLGIHMIGPNATELVHEGVIALNMGATAEDIAAAIHAHPTVGESFKEAAHAVFGNAINMPPAKK